MDSTLCDYLELIVDERLNHGPCFNILTFDMRQMKKAKRFMQDQVEAAQFKTALAVFMGTSKY